jgi:predicted nucleic acid-binding protein
MSKLTFVDSGVLIAAARGADEVARLAMTVLDDPDRIFASSALVRFEVLPKALRHQRDCEARFYETFFQSVSAWASISEPLAEEAFLQARNFDLHAMDALHIAAALSVGADEFITGEKSEKPINKLTAITVRTIHPLNQ